MDTRAREITDKHLDPAKPFKLNRGRASRDHKHGYFNEKEVGFDEKGQMRMHMASSDSPNSPSSTMVGGDSPHDLHQKSIDELVGKPPPPGDRKICGLRRRTFWVVFAVCLMAIVAAAVIGGVLGARRRDASVDTPPTPPTPASGVGAASSSPSSVAISSTSAAATLVQVFAKDRMIIPANIT